MESVPDRGAWQDWEQHGKYSLFVTAGRGLGTFVERELRGLSCTDDIVSMDGKVFFSVHSQAHDVASLPGMVAKIGCAERAFLW
jgi:hypothetical protein